MKISLQSLGCKVNQAEISQMSEALRKHGHSVVGPAESPDMCLINTCSVTAKSDYQSRQLIRRAARSGARVLVTGCYSELNPQAVRQIPGVEAIIKNSDKHHIINNLSDICNDITLTAEEQVKDSPVFEKRARRIVKVQDGCDASCSYCLIPAARGRSRSFSVDYVLDEVQKAVALGFNEVVLTAVHLGAYGRDHSPRYSLATLISEILAKTQVPRIRLSSLEVAELSDSLIELLSDRRVCPHLHIPLQSGDDEILKKMNRGYNTAYFQKKVERLLSQYPGISLGTDVICGFPGEGGDQFERTFNFISEIPFSYLHVFPFSPRPGTRAFDMLGKVDEKVKKQRCRSLRALSDKKKSLYMEKQVGRTLQIILEEQDAQGCFFGTSENYMRVRLDVEDSGAGLSRGGLLPVRITACEEGGLLGVID